MIKVVLVDDHVLVRTGIKQALMQEIDICVVGEASSGEEAINLVREITPHIMLLDINMPGIGGVGAIIKIRRIKPDIKIVVVTGFNHDVFVKPLLDAGIAGYITKATNLPHVLEGIRAVSKGHRYLSPDIANLLLFRKVNKVNTPFDTLSDRELQILMMVIRGMLIKEMAVRLHLSTKTINSYRYRIFDKLNIKNDVGLTLLAMQYGLLEISS